MITIFHISDTHNNHGKIKIPKGVDILIHSGDATNKLDPIKNLPEIIEFKNWWNNISVPHKVFVPGNHDSSIQSGIASPVMDQMDGHVLIHEGCEIMGLKFFGSPYCPVYGPWAFMRDEETLKRSWSQIPRDIDILVTHSPPKGTRDSVMDWDGERYCGCEHLDAAVIEISPILHCFGHIHDGGSFKNFGFDSDNGYCNTIFSNGSMMMDHKWNKEYNYGNLIKIPAQNK